MEIFLIVAATLLAVALSYMVRVTALESRRQRLAVGRNGERRIGEILDEAGAWDRLDDVVFGATIRRSAQVDHLVRCVDRLLVVETKNWSGVLAGGVAEPEWTLTRPDGEVRRMRNPLAQAERQARIVAEACGGQVDVGHLVVMVGRARPADGAFPPGVVAAHLLERDIRRLLGQPGHAGPETKHSVEAAWARLVEEAFAPGADRKAARYIASLEARFGEKPWQAWLVAALSFAVLAYSMGVIENAMNMGLIAFP